MNDYIHCRCLILLAAIDPTRTCQSTSNDSKIAVTIFVNTMNTAIAAASLTYKNKTITQF